MYERISIPEAVLCKLAGGRVLDVATGNGNYAAVMERCFSNCSFIVAIDTATKSLKRISEQMESEKIVPSAMDGSLLAFRDGTFDTVAISNSLHHLNNPDSILNEMMRILAPEGHLILQEMFSDGNQTPSQRSHTLLHSWWAATDSENGVVHNPVYTEKELKEHVKSIGLTNFEFYILEDLSSDPLDSELMNHLNKILDIYDKRAAGNKKLVLQGKNARAHLEKYGFTSARTLMAVCSRG